MENGRILLKNGNIFKTIKEENIKLWPGSLGFTPCTKAIGIVDNIPQTVIILDSDLKTFIDITDQLDMINEKYCEITNEQIDKEGILNLENRKLVIDLNVLKKELIKHQQLLIDAQRELKEKEDVISEYKGSPEDIRRSSKGQGIVDIIENIRNRRKDA